MLVPGTSRIRFDDGVGDVNGVGLAGGELEKAPIGQVLRTKMRQSDGQDLGTFDG